MPGELDARNTYKGIHSAWLSKVKGDGAKAKWIKSSGRRYFSIDFESQIVYYGHCSSGKRISLPIIFRDILSASMCGATPSTACTQGRSTVAARHRSHSGFSLDAWSRPPINEFFLQTKERRIQLVAESEIDALNWVEMLNVAARIGKEGLQPNMTGGYAATRPTFEPDSPMAEVGSPTYSQSRSPIVSPRPQEELRATTESPTELRSNATSLNTESRSTTEGSDTTEISVSSPLAWTDVDDAHSAVGATFVPSSPRHPPLPRHSAELAMKQAEDEAPQVAQLAPALAPASAEAAASQELLGGYHPGAAPAAAAARRPSSGPKWLTAAEVADASKVGTTLSSSGRLQFQVTDFGFDDEGASVRDSSPDSVTISPRPRAGSPNAESDPVVQDFGAPRYEVSQASHAWHSNDNEDDDSDCEVTCEVRDRRIEQDLELVKSQQVRSVKSTRRERSSSPAEHRRHKDSHVKTSIGSEPIVAKHKRNGEDADEVEAAARIAADLRLLQNPGRASPVALAAASAPAPLRKRSQQADADEAIDEEKARRRAARKAAKEAAAQELARQQTPAEGATAGHAIAEEVSEEEAKARRKAARRAAKEAAKLAGAALECADPAKEA